MQDSRTDIAVQKKMILFQLFTLKCGKLKNNCSKNMLKNTEKQIFMLIFEKIAVKVCYLQNKILSLQAVWTIISSFDYYKSPGSFVLT